MNSALRKITSRNQRFVTALTLWLENSPDSAEHIESLEEMATGSHDKTVLGMLDYVLTALEAPMPGDLEPEEMFGHLEKHLLERCSGEGDHYGPE